MKLQSPTLEEHFFRYDTKQTHTSV